MKKFKNENQFKGINAQNVSLLPTVSNGINIKSRRIHSISADKIGLVPTIPVCLFYMVFILAGLTTVILPVFFPNEHNISRIFVGLIFMTVGSVLIYRSFSPYIFDKNRRVFFYNKNAKNQVAIKFDDISGLQLLYKLVQTEGNFNCFELNLILKNKDRINLLNHGNLKAIRKDSVQLSQFIQKPLFDFIAEIKNS